MRDQSTPSTPAESPGNDADNKLGGFLAAVEKAARGLADMARKARTRVARGAYDAVDAVKWINGLNQGLQELRALTDEGTRLERLNQQEAQDQFLQLEARLREACKARGWRVEGEWPELFVERGITVEIDSMKREASVAGHRLRGAGVNQLMAALEVEVKELLPQSFDSHAFMSALARAYDAASNGRGGQIPTWDVYRAFVTTAQKPQFWRDARTSTFEGISVNQFRARLSKTIEDGVTATVDGRELRLLPPLKPEDGLFLYQPAEGRFAYAGRLELVPVATDGAS